jgi:hypothetical protein
VSIGVIHVTVVEVAVAGHFVYKDCDSGTLLLIRSELHAVSTVQNHGFFPWRVSVISNLVNRGILFACYFDIFLAEPLSVLACHLVIIDSCKEDHIILSWIRW